MFLKDFCYLNKQTHFSVHKKKIEIEKCKDDKEEVSFLRANYNITHELLLCRLTDDFVYCVYAQKNFFIFIIIPFILYFFPSCSTKMKPKVRIPHMVDVRNCVNNFFLLFIFCCVLSRFLLFLFLGYYCGRYYRSFHPFVLAYLV